MRAPPPDGREAMKTECPRQTLRPDGGKTGDGSAPHSLSRTGIRRALAGLPASRRCSPRQAESSASQQGRPAPCGHWISSEAFQLAWAGGCATGPRTRSRHVCEFLSASSPFSAGSASDFVGTFARCHGSRLFTLRLFFVLRPAVRFLHRRLFERFSRALPGPRVLPGANAHVR